MSEFELQSKVKTDVVNFHLHDHLLTEIFPVKIFRQVGSGFQSCILHMTSILSPVMQNQDCMKNLMVAGENRFWSNSLCFLLSFWI